MKNLVKRNRSGITLISLVVTIIILLILAGISISMLTGDNSILQRATEAKEKTDEASTMEQLQIEALGSFDSNGILSVNNVKTKLTSLGATVIGTEFPLTATYNEQKYTIDNNGNVQLINDSVITIAELQADALTYFGYDIINYAETLPIIDEGEESEKDYTQTQWQLFYAGALEGETEGRIYIISKDYIKNTLLPAKNGATPIKTENSDYKAYFSTSSYDTTNDGVLPQYEDGSNLITETKLQKLNGKFFNWLKAKNANSTNNNMRAVAYMMDTNAWRSFATSSKGYAEYAIGCPTIELLFMAYNKYESVSYEADVPSEKGYQVRADSTDTFSNSISNAIKNDEDTVDNPYSVSNNSNANGYWLSSPSNSSANIIRIVNKSGNVSTGYYYSTGMGFRPLVLLKPEYMLEKTKDSNGKDAFKIVEK